MYLFDGIMFVDASDHFVGCEYLCNLEGTNGVPKEGDHIIYRGVENDLTAS